MGKCPKNVAIILFCGISPMWWVKPPSVARKSPFMGCDLCRVASSFMINPHLLMLQTFSTNGYTGGCSSTNVG